MPTSEDEWGWKLTDPAEREYEKLQPHEQERIVSKLDEIESITRGLADEQPTMNPMLSLMRPDFDG